MFRSGASDLNERNAYWDAFKGKIQETSDKINDGFIKSQGVEDGVLSYNRVVQLILGYYASGGRKNGVQKR